MPRSARLVLPGRPHHVIQRGGRRVFASAADYRLYLRLLEDAARGAGTAILAWCLLPDRVRLILVPGHADGLRAALAEPHRLYAIHANRCEGRRGRLWRGRFVSVPLAEEQLPGCAREIELEPVRAGLAASPEQWPWSSARDDALTDDQI